jgi:hypothetical protein
MNLGAITPGDADYSVDASLLWLANQSNGRWMLFFDNPRTFTTRNQEFRHYAAKDTLTAMANLATAYRSQGRWTESESLEVVVMEKTKRLLGDDHLHTLKSMANLAETYWNHGRWMDAEAP